ncbi:MAG TPA: DUF3048 domain-containing protein [Clostridiales bacterium]|jgi:hypothetical protein|nr:DUF3048 domain-containing protein [Clostridiaceae bacterium]HPV02493.1 DUF3048 domain-containing protein [Clostridiales bacterium]
MKKGLALCLATVMLTASVCGCGAKTTEQDLQPVVVETTLPELFEGNVGQPAQEQQGAADQPAGPEAPAEDDYSLPFTGVRPVAVMIDNQGSRVLPQGGLDKAQIVYEVIVEGGLTRLMPVFWGTEPEMIGPVRSARHYFLDFSMEYDAIYVHYGGSPQAGADIKKLGINAIDGLVLGPDVFWDLTKDPGNWQDSYTSMEKLKKYAERRKYHDTTDVGFPFDYSELGKDVVPEGGDSAAIVELKYPSMTVRYDYDSETGTYKRFRYGKEHMERVSGKQLDAKNIIVLHMRNWTIEGDYAGRQDMQTTGTGKGYFITCGRVYRINWSKETRSSQTMYTYENGEPIMLNRGQTWIQVMPLNAKVTLE